MNLDKLLETTLEHLSAQNIVSKLESEGILSHFKGEDEVSKLAVSGVKYLKYVEANYPDSRFYVIIIYERNS